RGQQIAVRHVDLEQVEAALGGALRREDELVAHAVHVGAGHLARQRAFVEPLRPLWPICAPMRAVPWVWTKSTIRCQPTTWSSRYSPPHPGVIRPSADVQIISVITSAAPPTARAPRWTRWKSPTAPSTAVYMSIGETTTRLG